MSATEQHEWMIY